MELDLETYTFAMGSHNDSHYSVTSLKEVLNPNFRPFSFELKKIRFLIKF